MRKAPLALLLLLAAPLPAQTYLALGDNRLGLAQLAKPHPEGLLVCLRSEQGQSLEAAVQAALGQEPALGLQLSTQELEPGQKAGLELRRLKGWDGTRPHWALLGPDLWIYAEGSSAPSAAALAEAYGQSRLHSRAELLREFLKADRDHTEVLAQLLLETRTLGERRTRLALGLSEDEDPAKAKAALLGEEQDEAAWAEYAELFERFISDGDWLDLAPEGSGPSEDACLLSSLAPRSPRLKALAAQLLPGVETQLRRKPGDARRWQVWLALRNAAGEGRPGEVLRGLSPLPGAVRWPPAAALEAYVEDARRSGDWRDAEPLLQAAFDEKLAFLRELESATKEDAGQRWTAEHGGREGGGGRVNMGSYFGFGSWDADFAALLEAKLRLGKSADAERDFQELYTRVPNRALAQRAALLARSCGAGLLADKWEQLAK